MSFSYFLQKKKKKSVWGREQVVFYVIAPGNDYFYLNAPGNIFCDCTR